MEEQHALKNKSRQSRPSQAARDTATSFETKDLTPQLACGSKTNQPPTTAVDNQPKSKPVAMPEPNPLDIQVLDAPVEDDTQKLVRKGLPSWLTSLLVHFSLITSLALVSVSGNGKKLINLVAASEDSVSLMDPTEVEIEIETPENTSETTELDILDEALTESENLSEILDEAVAEAAIEDGSDELFESVASSGLMDSAVPRTSSVSGGARFFGVTGRGSDFVFIVDCSGSMADFGRWKQAKKELRTSISGLDEDQRFLILLYNDGFIAMNDEMEMVASTAQARRKANRWLNRNRPASWTFCAEALQQALSLKPDAVFLLSDGEFNDRNDVFIVLDEMNDKNRLQRLNRRQIPVHTVALGSHTGRFTMQQIADENSGVFKQVD